jgi:hypothetical protein
LSLLTSIKHQSNTNISSPAWVFVSWTFSCIGQKFSQFICLLSGCRLAVERVRLPGSFYPFIIPLPLPEWWILNPDIGIHPSPCSSYNEPSVTPLLPLLSVRYLSTFHLHRHPCYVYIIRIHFLTSSLPHSTTSLHYGLRSSSNSNSNSNMYERARRAARKIQPREYDMLLFTLVAAFPSLFVWFEEQFDSGFCSVAPEKNTETEQKIQPPSDIAISDIQIRNTDAFEGVADYLSDLLMFFQGRKWSRRSPPATSSTIQFGARSKIRQQRCPVWNRSRSRRTIK